MNVPRRFLKRWIGVTNYISLEEIDIASDLEHPPSFGSSIEREEIDAIVKAQMQSTPLRSATAIGDVKISPERLANGLLGPNFTEANAPQTFRLLAKVTAASLRVSVVAKERWFRPRPFLLDDRIETPAGRPTDPSYPSGHAVFAYNVGSLLGSILPEYKVELFERAAEYSQSRIVIGVHYPSDIECGRIAGIKIFSALLRRRKFTIDLASASKELRRALSNP